MDFKHFLNDLLDGMWRIGCRDKSGSRRPIKRLLTVVQVRDVGSYRLPRDHGDLRYISEEKFM